MSYCSDPVKVEKGLERKGSDGNAPVKLGNGTKKKGGRAVVVPCKVRKWD
jgi:hypothetical protein